MADRIPFQFDHIGNDEEFGEKLGCSLCDAVVYVKTGAYMSFSAAHICPQLIGEDSRKTLMANVTPEYHGQINEERLYWKHKFYVATEGPAVANRIIRADHEEQRTHYAQENK